MKRFFRLINPIVVWMLSNGWHRLLSFQVMALEFTGRRSGRRYRVPVSYAIDQQDFVCLTLASNLWWRNFIDRPELCVWYRGKPLQTTISLETENPNIIRLEIEKLIAHNPVDAVFAGVRLNFRLEPNPDDLTQAATKHVVLRVRRPAESGASLDDQRSSSEPFS
jgi:hypothetical protein